MAIGKKNHSKCRPESEYPEVAGKTLFKNQSQSYSNLQVEVDGVPYEVHGGDILLSSSFRMNSRLWEKGIIPYKISSGISKLRTPVIKAAMKMWSKKTKGAVTFVPYNREKHQDYVDFIDTERVFFGGFSYVGRSGGRQVLGMSRALYPPLDFSIALHEIGHLIGLSHEHNRSDRDKYIDVKWCNIEKQFRSQFKKNNKKLYGKYDYDSIMHYGNSTGAKITGGFSFSYKKKKIKNFMKSMTTRLLPMSLSKGDIQKVRCMYQGKKC